jgi:hypothetical protein
MGLFSRRQQPADLTAWLPEPGGGIQGGGDQVGGEFQDGESYRVRLRRADLPSAVIDVTTYVVNYVDVSAACPRGDYFVQVHAKWVMCEDPADPVGTEMWSLDRYDDMPDLYDDWHDAVRAAGYLAEELDRGTGRRALTGFLDEDMAAWIFTWDGQPFEWDEE